MATPVEPRSKASTWSFIVINTIAVWVLLCWGIKDHENLIFPAIVMFLTVVSALANTITWAATRKRKLHREVLAGLYFSPAILVAGLLFAGWLLSPNEHQRASRIIGAPVPAKARLLEAEETHGGFMGDGHTWMVFRFTPEQQKQFLAGIDSRPGWARLPLPKVLEEGRGRFDRRIPLDCPGGYYYFHDDQPEMHPKYSSNSQPFYARGSVNFRIAVFDTRNGTLYIWIIDT